jgi:hypothetical protein
VPESTTDVEYDRRGDWLVRALYTAAIAANLYLVFDWYRDTPSGQAFVTRCQERIAAAKARAENCDGCARRKAKLQAMVNRVHWDAERIVAGDDVETQPEQP